MKIALVNLDVTREMQKFTGEFVVEPLGLLYVSGSLVQHGHETMVLIQKLHALSDKEMFWRLAALHLPRRYREKIGAMSVATPSGCGMMCGFYVSPVTWRET